MNHLMHTKRLDYLLEMIEKKRIYSPKQIVQKFDCCDKTARNMINEFREEGLNIEYSKTLGRYIIKND